MKKLFGVIGDPISHSMSPLMHNDLFKLYNLDACYLPFHVTHEKLSDAVKGLKAIGVCGFNVTIPHKTAIIPLLDKVDPLARDIGAVNTVKNENGLLVGYNTDGPGFVKGLYGLQDDLEEKSVLVIGAGGAAKAIYYSLAKDGFKKIDLFNRTRHKAEVLVLGCPYEVETEILSKEMAEQKLSEYELIIQTTSIGMHPEMNASPLNPEYLSPTAIVSDVIYNPIKTAFLQKASLKGAKVQNGIDMFVFQGALAFEKWTGIFPDTNRMKNIVLRHLGG